MIEEITIAEFIKSQEQHEYPLIPEQLAPIKTLLEDHSAPVPPLAAIIARPILDAKERRRQEPDQENVYSYGGLWRVIADCIRQLTSQIDRIVDLVVALSQVPDPTGCSALMQDMREHWNEFAQGFTMPRPSDRNCRAIRQAWINMNTFNAKLSTYGIEHLDQRLRSGHVFRIALEETPWEEYHVPEIEKEIESDPEHPDNTDWRDKMLERRDVRRLNYWAPAAAAWIKYDGRGIYTLREPMIGDDYANYEPTNWDLQGGTKGFSKERFEYWRERFGWVSQVTALDHDTRTRAAEAADLMKKIEGDA